MPPFKISEKLAKMTHDLAETAKGNPDPEKIRKGIEDAMKLQEQEFKDAVRKGEFNIDDDPGRGSMDELIQKKAPDEKIKKIQEVNDNLVLMSMMTKRPVQSFNLYKRLKPLINESELAKAMSGQSEGYGAEWVPTGFSSDLIDKLELELRVAAAHPVINMPQDPFSLGRKISFTTAKRKPTQGTKLSASRQKVGTGKVTLASETIIVPVDISYELVEDAILATIDITKDDIVKALGRGIENATINGDTSDSHQDSDVTDSEDVRFCFKGHRKCALSTAKYNVGGDAITEVDMQAVRELMGVYGVNTEQLIWVVGVSTFNAMLNKTNFPSFRTVDKYGQFATVLRGELGRFDNIPVICSEQIREDLNASGVYDGTGNALTVALLVRRDGFIYGNRRGILVETDKDIEAQSTILVASTRKAFACRYSETTEKIVGVARNILA